MEAALGRSGEHAMTQTFTNKSNARRRARAVVGIEAVEGTHYRLTGEEGAWGFERIDPAGAELLTVDGVVHGNATRAEEAKRLKAEAKARAASADKPKTPKDPDAKPTGKSADLVTAVLSEAGITTAEIRALTGWSKIGGFYGAVQRANITLHRVREDGDTRWFGIPAEAGDGVRAYLRTETAGKWTRLGSFRSEADALATVEGDYAGEAGKTGGFFISPRAALGKAA